MPIANVEIEKIYKISLYIREKWFWILTTVGKIVCCVKGDKEASSEIKI